MVKNTEKKRYVICAGSLIINMKCLVPTTAHPKVSFNGDTIVATMTKLKISCPFLSVRKNSILYSPLGKIDIRDFVTTLQFVIENS